MKEEEEEGEYGVLTSNEFIFRQLELLHEESGGLSIIMLGNEVCALARFSMELFHHFLLHEIDFFECIGLFLREILHEELMSNEIGKGCHE